MDKIEKILNSTVQHGKFNDRIYLMKLDKGDCPEIISLLDSLAIKEDYSKIFAKIPLSLKKFFIENGYIEEAKIPKFFSGSEDALFVSKFIDDRRLIEDNIDKIDEIIELANSKGRNKKKISEEYTITRLSYEQADEMAAIYRKVFKTYPFPIYDPEYIVKTMRDNVVYFGILKEGRLIALSSSETDIDNLNVEMTDFACLPGHRGNNLAYYLLEYMEKEMQKMGIVTFYTIARAMSSGMNITFGKLGYTYSGTLIKNTNISGGLESMNIWYKNV